MLSSGFLLAKGMVTRLACLLWVGVRQTVSILLNVTQEILLQMVVSG